MIRLILEQEGHAPRPFSFSKRHISVGRGPDNDLPLPFRGVSGVHCQFTVNNKGIHVEDLRSTNGTHVNGRPIRAPRLLAETDVVTVGTVRLRLAPALRPEIGETPQDSKGSKEQAPPTLDDSGPRQQVVVIGGGQRARGVGGREAVIVGRQAARDGGSPGVQHQPSVRVAPGAAEARGPSASPGKRADKEGGPGLLTNFDPEGEELHPRIEHMANRWVARDYAEYLLLSGPLLRRAEKWIARGPEFHPRPDPLHIEYVKASRGASRSRRVRIALLAGGCVTAVVGGALTAYAWTGALEFPNDLGSSSPRVSGPICGASEELLARSRELAGQSRQQPDSERAILQSVHALRTFADHPGCVTNSPAERALRDAMEGFRGRMLGGHSSEITAVATSRDGSRLLTASRDGRIRVWDRQGKQVPLELRRHTSPVQALAVDATGRWLVSGDRAGALLLWDLESEEPTRPVRTLGEKARFKHTHSIRQLAFSGDGRFFASADTRGAVALWDLRGESSGSLLDVLWNHSDPVTGLAFSGDTTRLFSTGEDGKLMITSLSDGKPRRKPETRRIGAAITSLAIAQDGERLLTGDAEGRVVLWRGRAKRDYRAIELTRHKSRHVLGVALASTTNVSVSIGSDGAVHVVDLSPPPRRGSTPLVVSLERPAAPPTGLALDPEGSYALVSTRAGTIYVWDLARRHQSKQPIDILSGHEGHVTALAASVQGGWLLSGGKDKTAHVWDLNTLSGSAGAYVAHKHKSDIRRMALDSGKGRVITASTDGTVRLWTIGADSQPFETTQIPTGSVPANAVALSPGSRWAAAAFDSTMKLWNVRTLEMGRDVDETVLSGHRAPINEIAFTHDGRWLVSAGSDGLLLAWREDADGKGYETEPRVYKDGRDELWSLTTAHSANRVATGDLSGAVYLHDLDSADEGGVKLWSHKKPVWAVEFSRDGAWLASGGADASVRVWSVDDGAVESANPHFLRKHQSTVHHLAFSPNGDWLASAGDESMIVLWDLSAQYPSETYFTVDAHSGDVTGLSFESGQHRLFSASADSTIHAWTLADAVGGREGAEPLVLTGHTSRVAAVELHASGDYLVTSGDDATLRVWPLRPEALVAYACRAIGVDTRVEEISSILAELGAPSDLCRG